MKRKIKIRGSVARACVTSHPFTPFFCRCSLWGTLSVEVTLIAHLKPFKFLKVLVCFLLHRVFLRNQSSKRKLPLPWNWNSHLSTFVVKCKMLDKHDKKAAQKPFKFQINAVYWFWPWPRIKQNDFLIKFSSKCRIECRKIWVCWTAKLSLATKYCWKDVDFFVKFWRRLSKIVYLHLIN